MTNPQMPFGNRNSSITKRRPSLDKQGDPSNPAQWNNPNHNSKTSQQMRDEANNNNNGVNQSVKTNTGQFTPNTPGTPGATLSSVPSDTFTVSNENLPPRFNPEPEEKNPESDTEEIADQINAQAKVKVSANDNAETDTGKCSTNNQLPNIIIQLPGMQQCPMQWSTPCSPTPSNPPACKKAKKVREGHAGKNMTCPPNQDALNRNNPLAMYNNFQNPMTEQQMYETCQAQAHNSQFMPMFGGSQAEYNAMLQNQSFGTGPVGGFPTEYQYMPGMNNFPSGGQDFNDQSRMQDLPFYYNPYGASPFMGETNLQQPRVMPDQYGEQMYANQQYMFVDPGGFPIAANPYTPPFRSNAKAKHFDVESSSTTTTTDTSNSSQMSNEKEEYNVNNHFYGNPYSFLEPRCSPTGGFHPTDRRFGGSSGLHTRDQQTSQVQMANVMLNSEPNEAGVEESVQTLVAPLSQSPATSKPHQTGAKDLAVAHTGIKDQPNHGVKYRGRKGPRPSMIPKRLTNLPDSNVPLEQEIQRQQKELKSQRCSLILQQELQNQRETLLLQRQLQTQRQALLLQQELQNREQALLLQQQEIETLRKKPTFNSNNSGSSGYRYKPRKKSWNQNHRMKAATESSGRQIVVPYFTNGEHEDTDPMDMQIYQNEVVVPSSDQNNFIRSIQGQTSAPRADYAMKIARLKEHNRLPMLSTIPPTERYSLGMRSRNNKRLYEQAPLMVRGFGCTCRCNNISTNGQQSDSGPASDCEFPSITELGLEQLQKKPSFDFGKLTPPVGISLTKIVQFQAKFGRSDGDEG